MIHNLTDCSPDTIQAKHNEIGVLDGDILQLPSCSGTGTQANGLWTGRVEFTKAITLIGNGCTLDGNNRPTACNTVITDNRSDTNSIISFHLVANDNRTRLSSIQFNNGGNRSIPGPNYGIYIEGPGGGASPPGSERFRIDHIYSNGVPTNVSFRAAWGVIDHVNYALLSTFNHIGFIYDNGPDRYETDQRWADATDNGTDKFVYIENSTFTRTTAQNSPIVDWFSSGKLVFRFNDVTNSYPIEVHGTDSHGRNRGGRAVEAYNNTVNGGNGTSTINNIRSGTFISFNNIYTNFNGSLGAAVLNNQRTNGHYEFGVADGTNQWDINPGSTVAGPFTPSENNSAPAGGFQSVKVAGAGWTPNEFQYKIIRKSNCLPIDYDQPCGLIIYSNTADTITYPIVNVGTHLDFTTSDQFVIRDITHVLDAPCRSGGTLLVDRALSSLTASGTTATATLASHGFSTNDYVGIFGGSVSAYRGTWQITLDVVDPTNKFTFIVGQSGLASSSNATVSKIPVLPYDQVTEPCYQWLNTADGSNAVFDPHWYPTEIRANEHYFDYSSTATTPSTNQTTGVRSGTIANRPDSGSGGGCTTGVAYWATDEGSWNLSGVGGQGLLYKCTSTDTWTLYYTPYTYPHPRATTEAGSTSIVVTHQALITT